MFYIYVRGKPLCSFLTLESALDAYWDLFKAGRDPRIVKKPEPKSQLVN